MTDILHKEQNYIKRLNSNFIGQKIAEIFYEEINYESDIEYWNYSDNIHSVDMNVIFKFENGKLLQIKWDNEFYCYGIGFEEIRTLIKRKGFKTVNVSQNSNWNSLIGKTITSVDIYWDKKESQEYQEMLELVIPNVKKKQIKLPLSWKLNFQNEFLFISAFEIKDNGNNYYWADNLTIFFKDDDFKKYRLNQRFSR
ncbi:hypothetical protein [Chryseobacterium caseinilyticum]|uniref:Uncharacterized protein n=1 Tax=Chryseobacterium caseinilyticum TaxID=2771428 RepID=A0ABR8ZGL5_9FLAO|nr:hypothetical protein [Chryseobacterium caseinilyticum]MBD8084397.1 hypothetical protein [Chryseobacterium caseinilyticum]